VGVIKALKEAKTEGFLKNTDIGLHYGAGAYVCGEETALLESLEGKRGEPRLRPPYPTQCGLFGKPTVINNVETASRIPMIISDKKLTKLYPLSGNVKRPGVYELPFGISAERLIYDCGRGPDSGSLKAFAAGGVSGGIFPCSKLDIRLPIGSGAVIAINDKNCILDINCRIMEFFLEESCGKCTPCREGTEKLFLLLTKIKKGSRIKTNILEEIGEAMAFSSICGLGQSAPICLSSSLKFFKEEIEEHFKKRCRAGVCF
jgi:NADH-quinone oxidoreductase subunit F